MRSIAWVVALGFLALSLNGWAQQGPPPGGRPPREKGKGRAQDVEKKDNTQQEPPQGAQEGNAGEANRPPMPPPPPRPPMPRLAALDPNGDHVIDAQEIAAASAALLKLDKNGDGKLTPDEFLPPPPPMRRGPEGVGPRPPGRPGKGGTPPPPPAPEEEQE